MGWGDSYELRKGNIIYGTQLTARLLTRHSQVSDLGANEYGYVAIDTRTRDISFGQVPPIWQGGIAAEGEMDLALLSEYTTLTGNLPISNTQLESINSLLAIDTIGGNWIINNNEQLSSLRL